MDRIKEITDFNQKALAYYREACRILAMPFGQRKAAIGDDERLKAEVKRIHIWRKENAQKR